jgi:carbon-monoxide dehydrogenase medium subunit
MLCGSDVRTAVLIASTFVCILFLTYIKVRGLLWVYVSGMHPFEYLRATDIEHAVALLARHAGSARVLAGGTDLLVELRTARSGPDVVIDISRLSDLKGIERTEEGLRIGALATHTALTSSALVRSTCAALGQAASAIGAVQTRNTGTIGGNLMTCVPSMDGGPPLLALDASVILASEQGERRLGLREFFVGPRKTAARPDELMTHIVIPEASLGKPMAFLKFGLRKGQALALVNVAAGFFSEGEPAVFESPRIALGAVAPTVIRAFEAEKRLANQRIGSRAIREAAEIAATEASPIDDFRASAAYRRSLIAVLVRRALEEALANSSPTKEKAA